jgi:hypothetical protein
MREVAEKESGIGFYIDYSNLDIDDPAVLFSLLSVDELRSLSKGLMLKTNVKTKVINM